jgi:hypothetical protein
MAQSTAYALSESDVKLLRLMAERYRKQVKLEEGEDSLSMDQTPDIFAAKTPAGGIDAMTGATPGFATCEIYNIVDGDLVVMTGLERKVYNLSTTAIAGDIYVQVTRTKPGPWIVFSGGAGSTYYKHLGRFILSQALTTGSESAWGYMTDEYGEGTSHIGVDTGTGTGSGTDSISVIIHNLETHEDGVYEFYADAGDALLAYYDQIIAGVEHWIIIIPECP